MLLGEEGQKSLDCKSPLSESYEFRLKPLKRHKKRTFFSQLRSLGTFSFFLFVLCIALLLIQGCGGDDDDSSGDGDASPSDDDDDNDDDNDTTDDDDDDDTVNHPPVLNPIGDQLATENAELSITVTASDPDGDDLTFSASNLPPGSAFDPVSAHFSWTPTFDQADEYEGVRFEVSDGQDIDFEEISITVENINRPPVLDPIGDQSTDENSELAFTVTATDPDVGDDLTLSALNLPTGATFDPETGEFSWTPDFTQAGEYSGVRFEVTDGEDVDFEEITITVENLNRPPTLDPIGDKSTDENQELTFTVTATDPDLDDSLTLSASNLPTGASFDPATGFFSWTPTFDHAGEYPGVHFEVTDGEEVDSEDITISVTNVNRAPVLNPIGAQEVMEEHLLQFQVAGSDPDGDPVTCSADNLPPEATFDTATCTFEWHPIEGEAGTYEDLHFELTDGDLAASEDVDITVTTFVADFLLLSVTPDHGPIGKLITLSGTFDPAHGPYSLSCDHKQMGISHQTSDTLISFVPAFDVGIFPLRVISNDGLMSNSIYIEIEESAPLSEEPGTIAEEFIIKFTSLVGGKDKSVNPFIDAISYLVAQNYYTPDQGNQLIEWVHWIFAIIEAIPDYIWDLTFEERTFLDLCIRDSGLIDFVNEEGVKLQFEEINSLALIDRAGYVTGNVSAIANTLGLGFLWSPQIAAGLFHLGSVTGLIESFINIYMPTDIDGGSFEIIGLSPSCDMGGCNATVGQEIEVGFYGDFRPEKEYFCGSFGMVVGLLMDALQVPEPISTWIVNIMEGIVEDLGINWPDDQFPFPTSGTLFENVYIDIHQYSGQSLHTFLQDADPYIFFPVYYDILFLYIPEESMPEVVRNHNPDVISFDDATSTTTCLSAGTAYIDAVITKFVDLCEHPICFGYKTWEPVFSNIYRFDVIEAGDDDDDDDDSTGQFVDTGQTACYDDAGEIICPAPGETFYGQDAQYGQNTMSFTDNGNGTVTHVDTTLMWQAQENGNQYNIIDASGYCGGLNLGGFTDWRLPERDDLMTLVDYSTSDPSINSTYFPDAQSAHYWTDTRYADDPNMYWYVDFFSGGVNTEDLMTENFVRCVRGNYHACIPNCSGKECGNDGCGGDCGYCGDGQECNPWGVCEHAFHWFWYLPDTNQYLCFDDSGVIPCPQEGDPYFGQDAQYFGTPMSFRATEFTVVDNVTGLEWERGVGLYEVDFVEAEDFCSNLPLGGYGDWRLPSRIELMTIVDYSLYNPALDDYLFHGTGLTDGFWTGTDYAGDDTQTWCVYFGQGGVGYASKTDSRAVRCVRGEIECIPNCVGKQCGSDGCGGDCGYCWGSYYCKQGLCIPASPNGWPLSDTGQYLCYDDSGVIFCPASGDPFYGQDAQYFGNQPNYQKRGDNTVLDLVTGLIWQQDTSAGLLTWDEAGSYCSILQHGGLNNWRVPSRIELMGLVDYSKSQPAWDTTVFSGSSFESFWCSTEYAGDATQAWVVDFNQGSVGYNNKDTTRFVRCVHD